jgi:hypothetical protein
VGLALGPAHEAARIAAVHIGALDEREARPRTLQDPHGSIPVLDGTAVDLNREKAAIGVGQDVALASPDLLAGIIVLRCPF